MTPCALAKIHAACFPERPWRADELQDLLQSQSTLALCDTAQTGFAIAQTVADEAELLTIAIIPQHQSLGAGSKLLAALLHALSQSGTSTLLLDVAEDNIPARALYAKLGFTELARRKAYYHRSEGASVDALVLKRKLSDLSDIPHSTALRIG